MHLKHLLSVGFVVICCFLIGPIYAQNRTVSGKVTDKQDGTPLIAVSVMIKGTTTGTNTGSDGTFSLSVPATTKMLVFTYIGYNTQEIDITGKDVVNAVLTAATTSLNEVVVIGYGSQRVQDATGSVASLSPKNFNKGVIASPEQLLQGRISGVQVTPSSGEPGAGININIRGASSIRSGNSPLFVVDGVPLDNSGTSGGLDAGAGTSSARNPLSFINPSDIENISVLKDASAAAIYGSRGANGVVLITTKKGSSGQGIQFSASTSFSTAARRYDLLNAADFISLASKAGADPTVIDGGANTDWQDQIFRSVFSQNYNLSFGGAKDASNYRFSFGYDDQNGIVEKSGLKRLTGRLNASQGLFKEKVKIDLNFTASNIKNSYAPISDNAGFEGSLIGAAILANPTYPIKQDGAYYTPGGSFRNPSNMLDYIDDSDNINRYLANISGTWNIFKNLAYKATLGLDHSDGKRSTWMDPHLLGYTGTQGFRSYNVPQVSNNGRGILQNQKVSSTLIEHTLTFNHKSGDNELNLLGGYSYQQFKNFGYNDIGWNQTNKDVRAKNLNDFDERLPGTFGDSTKSELQSFFARANYTYKDKYLLTVTFRADGSSKFGANNKYGYFPAAAFKWKIMNEDFAPKDIFDELSLRLNYGQTGNQEFPAYASLQITQRQLNGSNILISNASPNLKWETTTSYGAGIDFTVWKGRVGGSLDYFDKSTEDLLFLQDYPAPSAATRRWINLPGTVVNKGVELGLSVQAIRKESFSWEVVYNASIISNKVKNFGSRNVITGDISGQGLSGAYSQVIRNDEPLGAFYMQKFLGFDSEGFSTYLNQELSGTYIVGSALPKFTTGLTNNFTLGKFNASLFFNASTGFYVYNNTANAYFLKGSLKNGRNVSYEAANSPENTLNSGGVSTRFLEKGNFLRLSNASIGYNFALKDLKTFKALRLSLSGQNLFIITDYSGIDPEVSTNKARLPAGSSDQREGIPSRGIDYTAYPSARTFTLSLNAGF